MPRHIPRSHLSSDNTPAGTACGVASPLVLSLSDFLNAENRCQRCDRIRQELPPLGGRDKKDTLRYAIVLSDLTPKAVDWLQRLADVGEAGETLGRIANRYAK
jgi:hypothetical protein